MCWKAPPRGGGEDGSVVKVQHLKFSVDEADDAAAPQSVTEAVRPSPYDYPRCGRSGGAHADRQHDHVGHFLSCSPGDTVRLNTHMNMNNKCDKCKVR